jgi:16S rRNA (guanine527-N7)-methyltransferase
VPDERSRFQETFRQQAMAHRLSLTESSTTALGAYYQLLQRWNRRMNLTACALADDSAEGIDRLLIEPLLAAPLVATRPLNWFDLGSGGGSPAIPLRIVRPNARLTMVESKSRKAAFLREVVRQLELSATVVKNERFEQLAQTQPSSADLITIRGVRLTPDALSAIVALLARPGALIVFGTVGDSLPGAPLRLVNQETLVGSGTARLFHVEHSSSSGNAKA